MPITRAVLAGPDALLADVVAADLVRTLDGDVERIDAADHPDTLAACRYAAQALATPALFGPARPVLLRTASLDAAAWDILIPSIQAQPDAQVVIRCDNIPAAAVTTRLAKAGLAVTTYPEPTARTFTAWIRSLAQARGVELPAAAAALMADRLADDPARAAGIVSAAAAGHSTLDRATVENLTAGAGASAPAWLAADAACSGDVTKALGLLSRSEPVAVLTVLAGKMVEAGLAAEGHSSLLSAPAAGRARSLAGRLGDAHQVARLLRLVLDADAAAKRDDDAGYPDAGRIPAADAAAIAVVAVATNTASLHADLRG